MDASDARSINQLYPDRRDLLAHRHLFLDRSRSSQAGSILVACTPKSGSTFAADALARATGYQRREFLYDINGHNGWDLYLPKLLECVDGRFVAQHHLLATPPNLELIKLFGFTTLILVRDLFDTVVSLRDHCLAVHNDSKVVSRMPLDLPRGYCDREFTDQVDWIIEFKLPWYVQFFVGWVRVSAAKAIECRWLTYDQMLSDPLVALGGFLRFCRVGHSPQQLQAAIDQTRADRNATRFNRGVIGRGERMLSQEQKSRVVGLTRHYPDVDFSPLGIPREAAASGQRSDRRPIRPLAPVANNAPPTVPTA